VGGVKREKEKRNHWMCLDEKRGKRSKEGVVYRKRDLDTFKGNRGVRKRIRGKEQRPKREKNSRGDE